MLGKCFSLLCIISIVFAIFSGNMKELASSILEGTSKSVSVVISIIGLMAFWNGIMEVLKDSGIIKRLSKLLKPILKHIFPRAFKENVATEELTLTVTASILGLSNATTPLALSAIEKLNENNKKKECATNDMIMLATLGSACFNLIPTTIIAIRLGMGAGITYEIIIPVWICSLACMLLGIILCRIIGKISGEN